MKNILVTGGAGLTGSNFVRYLINDRKNLKLVNSTDSTSGKNITKLNQSNDFQLSMRIF